jgi:hypothetical protein
MSRICGQFPPQGSPAPWRSSELRAEIERTSGEMPCRVPLSDGRVRPGAASSDPVCLSAGWNRRGVLQVQYPEAMEMEISLTGKEGSHERWLPDHGLSR